MVFVCRAEELALGKFWQLQRDLQEVHALLDLVVKVLKFRVAVHADLGICLVRHDDLIVNLVILHDMVDSC